MRSMLRWMVVLSVASLAACDGDDAALAPGTDGTADAGDSPPEPRDAGGTGGERDGSLDPAPDAGPGDDGTTTMDRCFGTTCLPSRLPPQPDLEFLEDMGDGWQRLMEADWELAAGSEGYRCMTLTIPRDAYLIAFAPQSPPGTHHATFGVSSAPRGPDEVVACGVGTSGERRLQGSGAGSEPSALPPGVAQPLHAGEQVTMNVHLFNVSEQPLRGRSGMWVKTVARSEVEFEAETVLAGPLSLEIPIGRSTQSGSCTLRAAATIYGVAPHMHQTGTHLRVTAETAAGQTTLHDGDYDFQHQLFYPLDGVELEMGDRVIVECTYENDTDRTLHWGDSSLDEMCFVGLGLYPAIGYGQLPCSN